MESPERPSKRKLNTEAGDDDAAKREAKKVRRKAAKAARKASAQAQDENIDETSQTNLAMGRMNPAIMADHMARQLKHFEPGLDDGTLEDLRVPERALVDTSSWEQGRTLEQMSAFIGEFSGLQTEQLAQAPDQNGAPHTLVVCSAAIRAADTTRALRCFQGKSGTVGKLFAKHIKLKEAIEYTSKTKLSVGVGTPQRILDLMDAGALSLKHLKRVVIDGSWCGAKQRTLFEQADALPPTMRLLARDEMKPRYGPELGVLVF